MGIAIANHKNGCDFGALSISDPPTLAFRDFLAFFLFPIFLVCFCVFPSFFMDFRGSAKRNTLVSFGVSLAFSKKQELEGQGKHFEFSAPNRGL